MLHTDVDNIVGVSYSICSLFTIRWTMTLCKILEGVLAFQKGRCAAEEF